MEILFQDETFRFIHMKKLWQFSFNMLQYFTEMFGKNLPIFFFFFKFGIKCQMQCYIARKFTGKTDVINVNVKKYFLRHILLTFNWCCIERIL